ncbi:S41 family peptidase [Brevundimonas sp.]|uniref:S41 family peptidase n=1 Tax=Brevundimonas sp. TaxID=1871086 RepID=UPI002D29863F|nr:S41 family peptidase [Brevundimonas sp.]HYC75414.1 S41 family peptidase [Brevundimonas sp.]
MKLLLLAAAAAAAAVLTAAPCVAQDPAPAAPAPGWMTAPRDWRETLRQDATALHALIIESHPGVHDTLNPGFRASADAGLAEALRRAETATDAGGWWWALRAFVGSFDDGHVQLSLVDQTVGFPARWPGFLTVYRGADQVVAVRDEADASLPPPGAKLLDCDGVSADRLAAQRIGTFRGRWFLESQRALLGDWLFLNASNPWISEMKTCRFESEGRIIEHALNWRAIEAADLSARRTKLAQGRAAGFGLRTLDDGGVWVSMPSFNGAPGSDAHKALTPMLADLTARQAELRTAPLVVLDLRGNGGGSTHWGQEIAAVLWGEDWVRAHPTPPVEAIEWRASEDNLAAVQSYLDEWTAAGESEERIAWAREIVEGMTAARAAGELYWRDRPGPRPEPDVEEAPQQLVHGPVYVLTDPVCSSACLDAVDLWKSLGAIQIGRETSADTVYMDVRGVELPSGLARVVIPMKVWRGRQRGNNEPQRPVHLFEGDMTDGAALEAWVRGLD